MNDSALATLIQLSKQARQLDKPNELVFQLVNDTINMVAYDQAALWLEGEGVVSLSGVAMVDKHAPYVQWLSNWFKQAPKQQEANYSLDLADIADPAWQQWLPSQIAMITLPSSMGLKGGYLFLARAQAFSSAELALLQEWAETWTARYHLAKHNSRPSRLVRLAKQLFVRWPLRLALISMLATAALWQIPLSVLAPADVVPLNPHVVRASMEGVLDQMWVQPNQRVITGDALFGFDMADLEYRQQVAEQSLLMAKSEYESTAQQALFNAEAKAKLTLLNSNIERHQLELSYLQTLLDKAVITAPIDGIALFASVDDWLGEPLSTGQKVMVLANEDELQLEAWLAPEDAIDLQLGSQVLMYPVANPDTIISATITLIGHEPVYRPEGYFAYRVRALPLPSEVDKLRLGAKGTVKLQGQTVALWYWVVRKPWAALRGYIGL